MDRFMASLERAERSPFTIGHYRDDLRFFAIWWRKTTDVPLAAAAITAADVGEWKRFLREDPIDGTNARKPATINAKLSALKAFLKWAHGAKLIVELPLTPPREKLAIRAVKWLEPKDQNRLLRSAARERNPRTLAMIEIMIETGVRVSELVAIERRDVTISERKGDLAIREGKGRRPRTIPLSATARAAFQRLLDIDQSPASPGPMSPVFVSQRGPGAPLGTRGVHDSLAKFGVHPHQLRHTFGMNHIKAGDGFPVVARLMGHTSVVTTMNHYGTPSESDLRRAVDPQAELD